MNVHRRRERSTKTKDRNAANGVSNTIALGDRWSTLVDGWFVQANAGEDGRVHGSDAVQFFRRSGLDDEDLARVWDKVVPPKEDRMNRIQFENALKLVALLQTGGELSDINAVEAISQNVPDPEPVFRPVNRSPSPQSMIPQPPCQNPRAGDTRWLPRRNAASSSKLPSGDSWMERAASVPTKSAGVDERAPRSRSFSGGFADGGRSPKTGRGSKPPRPERVRSTSMPCSLDEDEEQIGRPATGALRFVRLDEKIVRVKSPSKASGRQGFAKSVQIDEHLSGGRYVASTNGLWAAPDYYATGPEEELGQATGVPSTSGEASNRMYSGAMMDGRPRGAAPQGGKAAAVDNQSTRGNPRFLETDTQVGRDGPVPSKSVTLEDFSAPASPMRERRASADYYLGAGSKSAKSAATDDSLQSDRPLSARAALAGNYGGGGIAKPPVADEYASIGAPVSGRSRQADDHPNRDSPLPGRVTVAEEYAGASGPVPGRVADGGGPRGSPVPYRPVASREDSGAGGSPAEARAAEVDEHVAPGPVTSDRAGELDGSTAKNSPKSHRFEELKSKASSGTSGRFAELDDQEPRISPVHSRSADDLVAGGGSIHGRPGPPASYGDSDDDYICDRRAEQSEQSMRSYTPSSVGGRSSRLQTPSFSDDMVSELAGSDLAKDVTGPCTAGLVNVELRLPPLRPNSSAKLKNLAAVNGSLVAFPSLTGGLLQWIGIHDSLDGLREIQRLPTEDPDSAACAQIDSLEGAKVTSYAVHDASGFLWLGHDNGVVSSWYIGGRPQRISRKVSVWRGHRHGSISAMAVTPWGALWTGSTKGSIRVWESPTSEGGPTSSLTLCRSRGEKPHAHVKDIVVSTCGSLVWTCGHSKLGVWDAYTRKFLGLIDRNNEDKLIDTRRGIETEDEQAAAMLTAHSTVDDSAGGVARKKKHVGGMVSKNGRRVLEKSYTQPQMNDFVPTKMGSVKALVAQSDGTIWVGYKNGVIERYYQNGRFIKRWGLGYRLTSMCSVGEHVWAGLKDGSIVVMVSKLEAIFKWQAHTSAVISMAVSGGGVATLGEEGSLKCWSCQIPNPDLDEEAWVQWQSCMDDAFERGQLKILCGTWNVGNCKPSQESVRVWLGGQEKADDADLAVVGLQQIEEGPWDAAKAAATELSTRMDQGSETAQWWANELLAVLDPFPTDRPQEDRWQAIGMRQLSGMLVAVFARARLYPYLGNVCTTCISCGVTPSGDNKGAVAFQCTLFRRPLLAVMSHLSAHQNSIPDPGENYDLMGRVDFDDMGMDGPNRWTMQMLLEEDEAGRGALLNRAYGAADMVVWVGDFDYCLDVEYDDAMDMIQDAMDGQGAYAELLRYSQCKELTAKGSVFPGLVEAPIDFQPTFKFDKNVADPLAYDSSETRRVPAWTDRIFFRGSGFQGLMGTGGEGEDYEDGLGAGEGDNPEALLEQFAGRRDPGEVVVQCERYEATLEACESAHKPVWSLLSMDFPVVIQGRKRAMSFDILKQVAAHDVDGASALVEVALRSNYFELSEGDVQELEVENRGTCKALVSIIADQSFQQFIPTWLQIKPVTMFVDPGFSETFTLMAIVGACDLEHQALPARLRVRVEGVVCNWGRRNAEYGVDVRLKPSGERCQLLQGEDRREAEEVAC